AANRQVHDTGRVTGVVERFEHRAADTAGRIVVFDDDESVTGRGRGRDQRLGVDRLHRVEVHHAGGDPVATELVRCGQAVVQGDTGADQRHLVVRAGPDHLRTAN